LADENRVKIVEHEHEPNGEICAPEKLFPEGKYLRKTSHCFYIKRLAGRGSQETFSGVILVREKGMAGGYMTGHFVTKKADRTLVQPAFF